MKGLVKCFKLQQTRSSTRITSNDRHNTCHAKLSKCCGKLYPSSAIHPSLPSAAAAACCLPPWGKQCIGGCLWLVSVSITHSSNGRAKKLYQDFHTARTAGWMDGQMEGWKKGKRDSCRDQRRRTLHAAAELKSDNRFYSIFPRCRKRFKNFSPQAKQKSKKKILETFNAVAAASSPAAGFSFSMPCLLFNFPLPLHTFLGPYQCFLFLASPWMFFAYARRAKVERKPTHNKRKDLC